MGYLTKFDPQALQQLLGFIFGQVAGGNIVLIVWIGILIETVGSAGKSLRLHISDHLNKVYELQHFTEVFDALVSVLQQTASAAGQGTPVRNREETALLLEQLHALLASGDTNVNSIMEESAQMLEQAFGEPAKRLRLLISRYDYPGALSALEKIMRSGDDSSP